MPRSRQRSRRRTSRRQSKRRPSAKKVQYRGEETNEIEEILQKFKSLNLTEKKEALTTLRTILSKHNEGYANDLIDSGQLDIVLDDIISSKLLEQVETRLKALQMLVYFTLFSDNACRKLHEEQIPQKLLELLKVETAFVVGEKNEYEIIHALVILQNITYLEDIYNDESLIITSIEVLVSRLRMIITRMNCIHLRYILNTLGNLASRITTRIAEEYREEIKFWIDQVIHSELELVDIQVDTVFDLSRLNNPAIRSFIGKRIETVYQNRRTDSNELFLHIVYNIKSNIPRHKILFAINCLLTLFQSGGIQRDSVHMAILVILDLFRIARENRLDVSWYDTFVTNLRDASRAHVAPSA